MFMSEEILGWNLKSKFYFLNHVLFFFNNEVQNRLTSKWECLVSEIY